MMTIQLRTFRPVDYPAVSRLWEAAGLQGRLGDDREAVLGKLERDPELFLVAADPGTGEMVGTVLGAYDGRRGWMYHLAVHPDLQGQGIGTRLVQELERRLRALGCLKLNLLVQPDNRRARAFYEQRGSGEQEQLVMSKKL